MKKGWIFCEWKHKAIDILHTKKSFCLQPKRPGPNPPKLWQGFMTTTGKYDHIWSYLPVINAFHTGSFGRLGPVHLHIGGNRWFHELQFEAFHYISYPIKDDPLSLKQNIVLCSRLTGKPASLQKATIIDGRLLIQSVFNFLEPSHLTDILHGVCWT